MKSANSAKRHEDITEKLYRLLIVEPKYDPWRIFAVIVLSFIVHMFILKHYDVPMILNDEAVYPNLAKSILNTGELRFFGMSMSYNYLAYPLVLIPVYLLPATVNRYFIMGIIGCVMMSLSAIPAFMLGKKITGKRSGAWCLAGVLLLLPDFALASKSMTEAMSYLLFFWMLYFAWRAVNESNVPCIYLTALFALVSFYTKPGYIAAGAIALILCVVFSAIRKNWVNVIHSAAAILMLGALIIGINYLIRVIFHINPDASYYGAANDNAAFNWTLVLGMLRQFCMYIVYFLVATVFVGVLVPVIMQKKLSNPQRIFLLLISLSVLATMVGSLFSVHINQLVNFTDDPAGFDRIHLRYVAVYVPVFMSFLFCDGITEAMDKLRPVGKKKGLNEKSTAPLGKLWFIPAVVIIAALFVFRFASASVSSYYFDVFSIALISAICTTVAEEWMLAVVLSIAVGFIFFRLSMKGVTKSFRSGIVLVLALVLVAGNFTSYAATKTRIDYQPMSDDAVELAQVISDHDAIFFDNSQKKYMLAHYSLDVQSDKTLYFTNYASLAGAVNDHAGYYSPYYVTTIGEHVSYDVPLPSDTYFVFSGELGKTQDFAPDVDVYTTANGEYISAYTAPNTRLFDSVLSTPQSSLVMENQSSNSFITMYAPELLAAHRIRVTMRVKSEDAATKMSVSTSSESSEITANPIEQEVSVELNRPTSYQWLDLAVTTGSVQIISYDITPLS